MEALARGRRGLPGAQEPEPGEPERKRVCKPLEAVPNEVDARLIDCAMELDSKQKVSSGCGPWATKTKQNSMIFEDQGSRGTAQPCPRCIAGESFLSKEQTYTIPSYTADMLDPALNMLAKEPVASKARHRQPDIAVQVFGQLSNAVFWAVLICKGHFSHILGC